VEEAIGQRKMGDSRYVSITQICRLSDQQTDMCICNSTPRVSAIVPQVIVAYVRSLSATIC